MADIKPCPFCGGQSTAFSESYGCDNQGLNIWHAWCGCSNVECNIGIDLFWRGDDILCESDDGETCSALADRAIELWNRRANECDREALLKIADNMKRNANSTSQEDSLSLSWLIDEYADQIREAIGEDAS